MRHPRLALPLLALLGLALAGCATTGGEYSSLPTSPHRQPTAAGKGQPLPTPETAPAFRSIPNLPPGEYADLMDRIRVGYALPDVQHYGVDRELESYRSRPDFLDRVFRRGSRYLYYIVTELEKRGMPAELALLPVVESAFNPVAYSRSRASGLWQFIPSSGKHYGLEQNWWMDERRDVIEATQAALTYLEYLHRYFNGDWFLAIAAYNGGEGTVSRAVARNAAAGRPTDFFSLDLKAETRDYVPKLLAMRRLVGNPEAYGLQFAPIANVPYFDIVDAGRQVHLGETADLAGISRDEMFALNPAFNRMTTPPHGPHRLLVPVGSAESLRVALLNAGTAAQVAAVAVEPTPTVTHKVKRGDTLTSISRRYGVPMETLREANGLRGSVIQPGQRLVISKGSAGSAPVAESRPELAAQLPERQKAAAPKAEAERPAKPRVHKVRSGDTLWGVARRYDVTVPALAEANGLKTTSNLTAGKTLEIPGKHASGSKSSSKVAAEPKRTTYKVRRGDTLSEIAGKFNVSVRELMTWNRLRQSSSLRAGQKLVVYSGEFNGG